MRFIISILIFISILNFGHKLPGQSPNIDSLNIELSKANSDSSKFDILWTLYYHYVEFDRKQAKVVVDQIADIAKNTSSINTKAAAYSILADFASVENKYYQSKNYYEEAIKLSEQLGDSSGLAADKFNLGVTYDFLGDYIEALKNYRYAQDLFEKLDDKSGIADVLGNIAILYSNQMDYTNSINYFLQAIEIRKNLGDEEGLISDLGNIGAVYHDYGGKIGNKENIELALKYYEQALEIQRSFPNRNQTAWLKSNIGLLYIDLENYDEALNYLESSIAMSESIGDRTGVANTYGNIGQLFLKKQEFNNALSYFNKSLDLAKETNDILLQMDCYESLSELHEKIGQFKSAYQYQSLLKSNQDSLFSIQKNAKFNELIALYENEKKENEINLLQQERKLNQLELEKQKAETRLYFILTLSMFLVTMAVSVFYVLQRRNKLKLETINQQLQKSQEELSELNKTKDRFFAIIAHDLRGATTSFQGIGMVIKNHLQKDRLDRINLVADRIDKSARQLNGLLDNLLNWAVTQLGNVPFNPKKIQLGKLVKTNADIYLETASDNNIEFKTEVPEDIYVLADQNGLSVVLRNLLSNAFKFTGEGGKIVLSAEAQNGQANIKICDTGIGISEEKLNGLFNLDDKKSTAGVTGEKGTGLGLLLCKEFISLHNGNITVESIEGKGSTFHFNIPTYKND